MTVMVCPPSWSCCRVDHQALLRQKLDEQIAHHDRLCTERNALWEQLCSARKQPQSEEASRIESQIHDAHQKKVKELWAAAQKIFALTEACIQGEQQ